MGTMAMPKLILTMSLPIMFSMMISALYNIVDSMFVARWSEDALQAVSLAFPVQTLVIAVATGTGVGMNSLLSKSLGEKDYEKANKAAHNTIFVCGLSYLVFALFAVLFSETFFRLQTSDPVVIGYGKSYLFITTICCLGVFVNIIGERLLQGTGRTTLSMVSQLSGAVTNIILDPIMIFGLCGFPEMGIKGAAIATVTGQIVGAILATFLNLRYNKEISLDMRKFRPEMSIIKTIYRVGLPSIIMQSVMSFTTFFLDKILILVEPSGVGVNVYGIYFKLQSFIFMPVFGLNNGIVPIVAYNYGARNKKRIVSAIKIGVISAVCIMGAGTLFFQIKPEILVALFHPSEALLKLAVPALKILSISFMAAGYSITMGSVFQALGNGVYSLVTTTIRQIIVILPVAYSLGTTIGIGAIWWAMPIAECAAVVTTTIFFLRIFRQKVRGL